jgi:hypothetical protein
MAAASSSVGTGLSLTWGILPGFCSAVQPVEACAKSKQQIRQGHPEDHSNSEQHRVTNKYQITADNSL